MHEPGGRTYTDERAHLTRRVAYSRSRTSTRTVYLLLYLALAIRLKVACSPPTIDWRRP